MIDAVLFDLDDTLYDQRQWLDGAWHAVASRAAAWGIDPAGLERALRAVAEAGSDRGGIIDQALTLVGAGAVPAEPLVAAFRSYEPAHLDPYPGVPDALVRLSRRVPIGLVSDGEPAGQRAKLAATGLADLFATAVFSDEHGRAHRKPDPLPFRLAAKGLGVEPSRVVFVGDRPEKDVAGPVGVGMRAIRVRTGEWRVEPDDPRALATTETAVEAIEMLEAMPELALPVGSAPAGSRA